MTDHFFEPERTRPSFDTSKQTERVAYPKEFDIPQGQNIIAPSAIVEQARNAYVGARFPHLISVSLSSMVDSESERDQEWATNAPYRLLASNNRIYVYTSTMKNPDAPHADLQVMRLDYDPNTGRVYKVFRDCDPSTFKLAVSQFPENTVVGKVRGVLGIEEPSEQDVQQHEKIAAAAKRVQETRDELKRLSRKDFFAGQLNETVENTSRIHQVGQAEYSVATNIQTEWLATYGSCPCYIVSIYDRGHKRGALTHIDATVDGEATLNRMAGSLALGERGEKEDSPQFQVTISGADQSSAAYVVKAYDKIKQWKEAFGGNVDVRVGNILKGSRESLALNLNTGEIRQFIPSPALVKDDGGYGTMAATMRAMAGAVEGKKPARLTFPPQKSK